MATLLSSQTIHEDPNDKQWSTIGSLSVVKILLLQHLRLKQLLVNKATYIEELLVRFRMENAKPTVTPIEKRRSTTTRNNLHMQDVAIGVENIGTIETAKINIINQRNKNIEVQYHFARNLFHRGFIETRALWYCGHVSRSPH